MSDVFPAARGLIYHFVDSPSEIGTDNIAELIRDAGIEEHDIEKVMDFLLYYGVLGLRTADADFFIYDVAYDLKPLKIRAARAGRSARYLINPAFAPALEIKETLGPVGIEPLLPL